MNTAAEFVPCRFGDRVSQCYHNPRCGWERPAGHPHGRGRLGRPASAELLGMTTFGLTVWANPLSPGGHLTWGGPGDALHLRGLSIAIDGVLFLGDDLGTVSPPCQDAATAQAAADRYTRGEGEDEDDGTPRGTA